MQTQKQENTFTQSIFALGVTFCIADKAVKIIIIINELYSYPNESIKDSDLL